MLFWHFPLSLGEGWGSQISINTTVQYYCNSTLAPSNLELPYVPPQNQYTLGGMRLYINILVGGRVAREGMQKCVDGSRLQSQCRNWLSQTMNCP